MNINKNFLNNQNYLTDKKYNDRFKEIVIKYYIIEWGLKLPRYKDFLFFLVNYDTKKEKKYRYILYLMILLNLFILFVMMYIDFDFVPVIWFVAMSLLFLALLAFFIKFRLPIIYVLDKVGLNRHIRFWLLRSELGSFVVFVTTKSIHLLYKGKKYKFEKGYIDSLIYPYRDLFNYKLKDTLGKTNFRYVSRKNEILEDIVLKDIVVYSLIFSTFLFLILIVFFNKDLLFAFLLSYLVFGVFIFPVVYILVLVFLSLYKFYKISKQKSILILFLLSLVSLVVILFNLRL